MNATIPRDWNLWSWEQRMARLTIDVRRLAKERDALLAACKEPIEFDGGGPRLLYAAAYALREAAAISVWRKEEYKTLAKAVAAKADAEKAAIARAGGVEHKRVNGTEID